MTAHLVSCAEYRAATGRVFRKVRGSMATDSDDGRTTTAAAPRQRRKRKGDERDIGAALRTAYQNTVEEAVPADLLDLLGKLN